MNKQMRHLLIDSIGPERGWNGITDGTPNGRAHVLER